MAVFVAKAVAMAKAASNISKATKVVRKEPERPSHPVRASPAKSLAIGPRTVKRTLQRALLPLHQNRSCQKKKRPNDARLDATGPSLA
jgi:hypothetical protein